MEMAPTERLNIETNGSSSRQKEYDLVGFVHGSLRVKKYRRNFLPGSTQNRRRRSVGPEGWYCERREAWMKQSQEVQTRRKLRGPAGTVMCETSDLGIKWTLLAHFDI